MFFPEQTSAQSGEVPYSSEFDRILALPRRDPELFDLSLVEAISAVFRKPGSSATLRKVQAFALYELYWYRCLFASIPVGEGKTLISYLAPTDVGAQRPLLIVPAKLIDKTIRDFHRYSKDWNGPNPWAYRVVSYQLLGRVSGANILNHYRPDLICTDESHWLSNIRKTACAKRVKRYIEENPQTIVVDMSGSMGKRSISDAAHRLNWTLRNLSPVPHKGTDLECWGSAIDEHGKDNRMRPGALRVFFSQADNELAKQGPAEELSAVRQAVRRRMAETPGVILGKATELSSSLQIEGLFPAGNAPEIEAAFQHLRTYWETPDGQPITDGIGLWRHARELGRGFYYRWNPYPPQEWLNAKREWAKLCREILNNNRRNLDTELQVKNAIDQGLYNDDGILARWRAIKPTFRAHTEPVWLSNEVLQFLGSWLTDKSIIWVEHIALGNALAHATGFPFFAEQGIDVRSGIYIEDYADRHDTSIICSVQSNAEGRNLHLNKFGGFSRNLALSPPTNGRQWEQMLGRTHRLGQEKPEVIFDFLIGCFEDWLGFQNARNDAKMWQDLSSRQKLCYADIICPTFDQLQEKQSFRWSK